MSCAQIHRTQAWLDGELDDAAAAEAAAHAESCTECKAFAAEFRDLRAAIGFQASRHKAPAHLHARIEKSLDGEASAHSAPPARRLPGFWWGTASGIAASALAAAVAFLVLLPPSAETLARAVTSAHTNALMSGRIITVASSDHHTVKPWFAGRIALSPPVADFAAQGFRLIGGRLDTVAGAPAAVLAYRHGQHEIDLYVWADRGSRLPGIALNHGYRAMFWRERDLDFAAVSDVEHAELSKFVNLVQSERE